MPKQSRPIPYQMATAAWLAPVLIVVANSAMRSTANGTDADASGTVVFAALAGLLSALGLVCALGALISVPKHGRKGLLIPGLIGLVLSGVYFFVLVSSFLGAQA